jgi:hypothetical protein
MSVLRVKNGDQWDIVPAIKGDTGDPAAEESITDAMLVPDGIKTEVEWLWGNQLTKELSGELMQASDAYGAPMLSLGVDGKSTQDGTPTPDAPVEIVSIEQVGLTFAGRNLLQITGTSGPHGSIMYTVNADKTIVASGTQAGVGYPFNIGTVKVKAGLTYHLSGCPAGGSTRTYAMYPASKSASWYDTGSGATFTPIEDETLTIRIVVGGGATYSDLTFKPQLELGSTATAYQPYDGTSVLLNLTQALRSLPDGTKDTLALSYLRPSTREGWAWYRAEVARMVHVMTLDGSEAWGADAIGCFHQMNELMPSTGSDYSQTIICDQLKAYPRYPNLRGITGISGYRAYTQSGANWLYVSVEEVGNNAAAMKAWLAEHRPTLLYKTNEGPTTTNLDPIELPVLPAPDVTVWSDPNTGLQMEYVRDTSIVIASLEAAYADLATS